MAFAALDEFHQMYIPGREASFWDLVADVGGLVLGFYASARFVSGKVKDG
jgi:VanZ family protein